MLKTILFIYFKMNWHFFQYLKVEPDFHQSIKWSRWRTEQFIYPVFTNTDLRKCQLKSVTMSLKCSYAATATQLRWGHMFMPGCINMPFSTVIGTELQEMTLTWMRKMSQQQRTMEMSFTILEKVTRLEDTWLLEEIFILARWCLLINLQSSVQVHQ